MARSTTETLVTQSVLDRLMAVEEWPTTRSQSLRFFKEALKRDLEWLLNTRQPPMPELADYPLAKAPSSTTACPTSPRWACPPPPTIAACASPLRPACATMSRG